MLRFAADECFDGRILRGLLRRIPNLDVVRIQDADLSGADDPAVLRWAAATGRVLLTQDATTMTRWAYERIDAREAMPGIIEVGQDIPVGRAIEDLVLLALAGAPEDCDGRIVYLPL